MRNYKEPEIKFIPNYQDSSKKKRTASWRGRIMVWNTVAKGIVNNVVYDIL